MYRLSTPKMSDLEITLKPTTRLHPHGTDDFLILLCQKDNPGQLVEELVKHAFDLKTFILAIS